MEKESKEKIKSPFVNGEESLPQELNWLVPSSAQPLRKETSVVEIMPQYLLCQPEQKCTAYLLF